MKGKSGVSGGTEFYWNPQMANQFLLNTFDSKDKNVKKQIDLWRTFSALGLHADWRNGEFIFNGYLLYEKENKKKEVKIKTTKSNKD